jgi:hypothetical protein
MRHQEPQPEKLPPQDVQPDNSPLWANSITPVCRAEDKDDGWDCTAAEGHTGYHMAYSDTVREGRPMPEVYHAWPQDAGDARWAA